MGASEHLQGKSSWHTENPVARMPKQHILEHLKNLVSRKTKEQVWNNGENFQHDEYV